MVWVLQDMKMNTRRAVLQIVIMVMIAANAQAESKVTSVLPVDTAFRSEVSKSGDDIIVKITISDGYQLYSEKFRVVETSDTGSAFTISMPQAKKKFDKALKKEVGYFTGEISIKLILSAATKPDHLQILYLEAQGCQATVGVCFPPFKIALNKSTSSSNSILEMIADKFKF